MRFGPEDIIHASVADHFIHASVADHLSNFRVFQLKNKDVAMQILRAKLYDKMLEERQAEQRAERGAQIGTGARSEKIRTYNWKDGRCSDHRLNKNFPLSDFLGGQIDNMIQECIFKDQQAMLAEMTQQVN